jgi:hypothetical protein
MSVNISPPKKKMNPMLLKVLIVSGLAHLVLGLVLGSITVYKYIVPDDAQFEEPPAVVEEVPPPDVRVEIKPQAAPQPQATQMLKMRQLGNIAIANVDVNLPTMSESFTVSTGLGGISGGGILGGTRGSIGLGMSDVSVFGLKTRAERILFFIDASRNMVTDNKGGLRSYRVIKDEITDMVGNLSAGTLFNVILFDSNRTRFFKPQLIPAGAEVTQELIQWIAPVNSSVSNVGLKGGRVEKLKTFDVSDTDKFKTKEGRSAKGRAYSPDYMQWNVQRNGSTTYLTQLALEQNVDAVFFITGAHSGYQRIRRALTPEESAKYKEDKEKRVNDPRYIQARKDYLAEVPEMRKKVAEARQKLDAERKKNGLPPKVYRDPSVIGMARELGLKWENSPVSEPGSPVYFIEERNVEDYLEDLVEEIYESKGGVAPSLNVVLFLSGTEDVSKTREDELKDYVRDFNGAYRIIRGEDEIKGARSARDIVNE